MTKVKVFVYGQRRHRRRRYDNSSPDLLYKQKQETVKDGKTEMKSKFQNLNAKVNQMWSLDGQTNWQMDRWTLLIHKWELLCNLAKNSIHEFMYKVPNCKYRFISNYLELLLLESQIHFYQI